MFTSVFGGQTSKGASFPTTVTVNVHDADLPCWSMAVYAIWCVPMVKVEPGASPPVRVTATGPQLSEALGSAQVAGALVPFKEAWTTMLLGQPNKAGS